MKILEDYIDKMRAVEDSLLEASRDAAIAPEVRTALRECATLAACMAMLMERTEEQLDVELPY